ncbi:hypothetical protein B296_00032116 [Ensete ventricosum]|uniref:Uncharacterized protein n=1 Tax=Ensete ventricosum TaxID=4639 RepID=A0A427ABW3_ENSVE|nr:hypothetical protein B296_00032116 [Ensete ventricosum]
MDGTSERDRSSCKSSKNDERERDSSKDNYSDRDRGGDHKHPHHHHGGIKNSDDKRRHRPRGLFSPDTLTDPGLDHRDCSSNLALEKESNTFDVRTYCFCNHSYELLSLGVSQVAAQESFTLVLKVSTNSAASHRPQLTKVSSFIATNENAGVSIRSDEVPANSITDGAANSVAAKSGSLSLDALAKAKRVLKLQKELSEKQKKIPYW